MKAKELADFYPNDLIVEKLVEEINHMKKSEWCAVRNIKSIRLLNTIYEKGLQTLFL